MRILIADDENLVRSGLRSMLEELDIPLSIVGEATNGEEALELVKNLEPDIVFIDIRMPKLNGLEAIKAGKIVSPHTSWMILSGFSEFNYAREAIQLGTDNYLLKPVSPEELEQALQRWIKENKKHTLFLNSQFENQMIALSHCLSSVQDERNQDYFSDTAFMSSVFFIDSYLEEEQKAQQILLFSHILRQCAHAYLGGDAKIAIFTLPTGELFTVGCWKHTKHTEGKKKIYQYFSKLDEMIDQFCDETVSVTAFQGEECFSFENLQQQVSHTLKLSAFRAILGIGKKWTIQQLTPGTADLNIAELGCTLIKLCDYYKDGTHLNYMKTLNVFETKFVNVRLTKQRKQHICRFLYYAIQCQLSVEEDLKTWITALQNHGNQLLVQHKKNEHHHADLVDQAIAFIDQNYMDNISVGQIAENLHVTPNYLSTLFHKKTGITFTKYIMKTRILKAKELLLNRNMQVQQVAEAVGYYSTRHFTKLFTELVGCYPSEFRNQLKEETFKK